MNSNPSILAVDDEPVRKIYERMFRREIRERKYTFLYANDGQEAFQVLEKHPEVGIILLDINMPGMDGLTFIATLKQQEYNRIYSDKGRFYKVIMVTAYADNPQYLSQCMNNGAYDWIGKPFDHTHLEIKIHKAATDLQELEGLKRRWLEEKQRRIEEQERRMNAERKLAQLGSVLDSSLGTANIDLGGGIYGN